MFTLKQQVLFAPFHALGQQPGRGQRRLDVRQPLGVLELAEPAVHVAGLVATSLHQLNQALLQRFAPAHTGCR